MDAESPIYPYLIVQNQITWLFKIRLSWPEIAQITMAVHTRPISDPWRTPLYHDQLAMALPPSASAPTSSGERWPPLESTPEVFNQAPLTLLSLTTNSMVCSFLSDPSAASLAGAVHVVARRPGGRRGVPWCVRTRCRHVGFGSPACARRCSLLPRSTTGALDLSIFPNQGSRYIAKLNMLQELDFGGNLVP